MKSLKEEYSVIDISELNRLLNPGPNLRSVVKDDLVPKINDGITLPGEMGVAGEAPL